MSTDRTITDASTLEEVRGWHAADRPDCTAFVITTAPNWTQCKTCGWAAAMVTDRR